jgi:hypothetical protein
MHGRNAVAPVMFYCHLQNVANFLQKVSMHIHTRNANDFCPSHILSNQYIVVVILSKQVVVENGFLFAYFIPEHHRESFRNPVLLYHHHLFVSDARWFQQESVVQ